MTWVNFRDVQDRFTHIDALFVSSAARFGPDGAEVTVTVRFYPWWEHPAYVAARVAAIPGASKTPSRARVTSP